MLNTIFSSFGNFHSLGSNLSNIKNLFLIGFIGIKKVGTILMLSIIHFFALVDL